ncbi:MAG: hypothetical protein EOM20_20340 [Spartobacteria bacterium]|nr:hypothetical protein [Spartobacteria bacterium]
MKPSGDFDASTPYIPRLLMMIVRWRMLSRGLLRNIPTIPRCKEKSAIKISQRHAPAVRCSGFSLPRTASSVRIEKCRRRQKYEINGQKWHFSVFWGQKWSFFDKIRHFH